MAGLVAIHQPNFFPWIGYFDKIRRADAFVFLDTVDYPRSGSGSMGSWSNRVRLAIQGEARWVSCPVQRMPLGSPISDAVIDDRQPWRDKLLKTLEANYRRAPRYGAALALIEPLIRVAETNLATFNIAAIKAIAAHLGVTTRYLRQSELQHSGSSTNLLVSLVKAAGGDAYLAGGGADGYQENHVFAEGGVRLVMQGFSPRAYGDEARFIPGLSVIDYVMWDGRPLAEAFPDPANA
ncbi:WbqC family protein [Bosea sp. (in: a-proteobacteria)]|uniref:WbqC family protein n=1 Tax=Bosea sp. (in: a-proteobacteria) TaxID=1871050 RepID=UPI002732FB5F|nr:WbqC family protein [Bosea sp. (in: a-proteobacteria)]MDP3407485.1 WbqC family protein [Bosea sp. (in: a-proteobacteria)]